MKVAFDLDGTLDRPAVLTLCKELLNEGHSVHIVSGMFLESNWQLANDKLAKLARMGLIKRSTVLQDAYELPINLRVKFIEAVDHAKFDRDYRLADIGLRKGAYLSEQGIDIMFDDSELYCKLMPAYCGTQIVHVR